MYFFIHIDLYHKSSINIILDSCRGETVIVARVIASTLTSVISMITIVTIISVSAMGVDIILSLILTLPFGLFSGILSLFTHI